MNPCRSEGYAYHLILQVVFIQNRFFVHTCNIIQCDQSHGILLNASVLLLPGEVQQLDLTLAQVVEIFVRKYLANLPCLLGWHLVSARTSASAVSVAISPSLVPVPLSGTAVGPSEDVGLPQASTAVHNCESVAGAGFCSRTDLSIKSYKFSMGIMSGDLGGQIICSNRPEYSSNPIAKCGPVTWHAVKFSIVVWEHEVHKWLQMVSK